eukprot:1236747-Prymnesium_polylepis.1
MIIVTIRSTPNLDRANTARRLDAQDADSSTSGNGLRTANPLPRTPCAVGSESQNRERRGRVCASSRVCSRSHGTHVHAVPQEPRERPSPTTLFSTTMSARRCPKPSQGGGLRAQRALVARGSRC